jgi:hypothetical protein
MNKLPSKRRSSGAVTKLAKALGFTSRHTGTLLKNGMPDTLTEAHQWLSDREDTDTAAALRRERIGLVKAQRLAAELANQKAAGQLVPRSEVMADSVRIASAMQAFLRKLEKELPQLCLGLTLSQSMPLVRQRMREIQDNLADLTSDFWSNQKT